MLIFIIFPIKINANLTENNYIQVTIQITRIKFEDPIDFDILGNENYEGDPYLKIWIDGHFFMSNEPIFKDEKDKFIDLSFSLNILDNDNSVDITIELWDDDISDDDLLDISGNGTDCDLTYYISTNKWDGDTNNNVSSGNDDGSTSIDEDDGTIEFLISNDEKTNELSIEKKSILANKFTPILYFKENEEFFPIEINFMLQYSDLKNVNNDTIVDLMPISIDSLFKFSNNKLKNPSYYIDFHEGDSVNEIQNIYDQNKDKYNSTIYANVFKTSNENVIIQYWFFYIFNDGKHNDHEGDWEIIQIILDENEIPIFTGYSQHYTGRARHWSKTIREGTHPIIYIAQDSHASYFDNGNDGYHSPEVDNCGLTGDESTGNSIKYYPQKDYSLELLNNQEWLHFNGYWGEKTDSEFTTGSQGPYYRHCGCNIYMWTNPMDWSNHLPEDNIGDKSPNQSPIASINANLSAGIAPLEISFKGIGKDSDGRIVSYYWDFNDGNMSNEQNPVHIFQNSGTYLVTLNVTDEYSSIGSNTILINVSKNKVNGESSNDDHKDNEKSFIPSFEGNFLLIIILFTTLILFLKKSKR